MSLVSTPRAYWLWCWEHQVLTPLWQRMRASLSTETTGVKADRTESTSIQSLSVTRFHFGPNFVCASTPHHDDSAVGELNQYISCEIRVIMETTLINLLKGTYPTPKLNHFRKLGSLLELGGLTTDCSLIKGLCRAVKPISAPGKVDAVWKQYLDL